MEHPICFASRSLNPAEKNYAATEGECLAAVWAIQYFRAYLFGRKFVLQTDHSALKWLMSTKDLTGKLARWSLRLQEYDFEIQYRPGASHGNVDALSRLPTMPPLDEGWTTDEEEPRIIWGNVMQVYEPADQPGPSRTPAAVETASESISEHLPCDFCGQENNWEDMILCDGCPRGFHMACLEPRVNLLPEGKWFCGNCEGDTQTSVGFQDIHDDVEVMQYLRHPMSIEDLSDQQKKRVLKRSKNYVIKLDDDANGYENLFRKPVGQYGERRVPKKGERTTIIERYHGLGHFGVLRTAMLIRQHFYWGGIVQSVKNFIYQCHPCRMQKSKFLEPPEMMSVPVQDTSFACVGIDLIGPLPVSNSGNKYIVTAIDYLTKWPETRAVPNKEASTIAEFFKEDVVARHGCPDEIISDNGGEFFGQFDIMLQEMGIDHHLTSPNHPVANGLVEHSNCTFMTALRKCMAEDLDCKHNWDKFLPKILLGYRATVQASTKYSPFYLCYAKHPRLHFRFPDYFSQLQEPSPPDEDYLRVPVTSTPGSEMPKGLPSSAVTASGVSEKVAKLNDAIPVARDNIEKAQAKQKKDYKRKRKYCEPCHFKVGDFCLAKSTKNQNKLDSNVDNELYKIVGFTNDSHKTAILSDASQTPKRWIENVQNISLFVP